MKYTYLLTLDTDLTPNIIEQKLLSIRIAGPKKVERIGPAEIAAINLIETLREELEEGRDTK